jgi:AbrB family looped-hinge helix DNA binding protein
MTQPTLTNNQEEWLKVLGKGMITLPKKWRDEMGIGNGDIVKAKKEGNRVVIEPTSQTKALAPYRVFSDAEIDEFLEEDKLPEDLAQKAQKRFSTSPKDESIL